MWMTIWFMVILKIPIFYLAWVIWWAVKDPPEAHAGEGEAEPGGSGDGPGWRPTRRSPVRRRGGPHDIQPRGGERERLARAS